MEIYQELIPGRRFCNTIQHLHYRLVVPVHEIDLESFESHAGINPAGLFQLFIQDVGYTPEYQANILFPGVCYQFLQVNLRDHLHDVLTCRWGPSFVQHYVFNSIGGRKVNEIFIGLCVDPDREIHACDSPVIPPVPGHFARFNPICGTCPVGSPQCIDQVIDRQFRVFFRYGHNAPGESTRSSGAGYKGRIAGRYHLTPYGISFGSRRNRRENPAELKPPAGFFTPEEHARIGLQVRFGKDHLQAVIQADQKRQKGQPFRVKTADRGDRVYVFE
ncbi:MAG: hypothetical protein BWX93_01964 [Bacteroidetes bacterium ADurb.Bin139]|nr:MAG: hypothetical protein BWX93_01964 [Bacteroidetes bacterium ADurb.Bin139]